MRSKLIPVTVVVIFLALIINIQAYTVCSSGCDYPDLTSCLNAANNTNNSCTITESGVWSINGSYYYNISDPEQDGVVALNTSNVEIDCNNTEIRTPNATVDRGIFSNSTSNITIKNCIIRNFSHGIAIYYAHNATVVNNSVYSSLAGIGIFYTNHSIITNNTANSNIDEGIYMTSSQHNIISRNRISNTSSTGISIFSGNYNITVKENEVSSSGYADIYVASSHNSTIINNTINSTSRGIALDSSNYNIVSFNAISSNFTGIEISGLYPSKYNSITNNTISLNNGFWGIYVRSPSNTISNNTISGATHWAAGYGLYLYSSNGSAVIGNTLTSNSYGLYLYSSNGSAVIGNTLTSNTFYGIYLISSIDNAFANNTVRGSFVSFNSLNGSINNTVTNLDIAFLVNFTSKDISLSNATAPGPDPPNYTNIGRYLSIINNSLDSWAFINISYTDVELGFVDESTLRLWKWDGSWIGPGGWASPNGVNTADNYVYANITQFSTFAPLGEATCGLDLKISSQLVGSQTLLAFTEGYHMTIRNRIPLIIAGQFLTKIAPSFAYGLGVYYPIKVMLKYSDIDLEGNINMQRGVHRLVIENNGTVAGRPVIVISGI